MNIEDIKGKVILHNDENGDLLMSYPMTNCGLSADEILEQISPLDNKYSVINQEELPEDSTYINSWTYDHENKKLDINVEKAKETQKDNIRIIRDKLLKEEDINFLKAVESGDTLKQNESSNRKQILRDLPEIVDNVEITESDIEGISSQIESAWDENLLGESTFIKKERLFYELTGE